MKAPRRYFDPLAIGAPRPLAELPSRLERMIHFIPPHNEKVRAKAAELVGQVDVVLGNLEDAIPIEAQACGPRRLDRDGEGDRLRLERALGARQRAQFALVHRRHDPAGRRDRRQARRGHGPQDRRRLGHSFPRPVSGAARGAQRSQAPHSCACDFGDRPGRQQCRGDRRRFATHAGHEPRPGRPRRLAGDENDPGRRAAIPTIGFWPTPQKPTRSAPPLSRIRGITP